MSLGLTLLRLQRTLHLNQRELAQLLGYSSRTISRYYRGGGFLLPTTYEKLAATVHPHDRAFAAELAASAGKTLVDLGLESSRSPAGPTPRHLVDSVLCAAAEAMQTPPHTMRPALTAAFERVLALGMTVEEALAAMTPEPPARRKPSSA
ncbi:MAG TPA: helix-turn-helix transcriptional regulator [Polyangiaceae bacterium]